MRNKQSKLKKKKDFRLLEIFTAVFVLIALIYIVIINSKILSNTDLPLQLIGTLIGMVLSAFITVLLLKGQTTVEESNDIERRVFEKKQEVYFDFIGTLEKITQDGHINVPGLPGYNAPKTEKDINDELQHLIYQLGKLRMTASSEASEEITNLVGQIIKTTNDKSGLNIADKYSTFAQQVFEVVSILRKDMLLYEDNRQPVDIDNFRSALSTAGLDVNTIESDESVLANYCDLIVGVLKGNYNTANTYIAFGGGNNETQENIDSSEAASKFLIKDNKARYIQIRTPLSGNLKFDIELVNDPRYRELPMQGGLRKVSWIKKFDYDHLKKINFVLKDAAFFDFKNANKEGREDIVKDMLAFCLIDGETIKEILEKNK